MFRRPNQRRKRNPSLHQKRIRFLTGLSILIVVCLTALVFWLANRGFGAH